MNKFFITVSLLAVFTLCSAAALAAGSVGMVLTVQQGAWAERNGEKVRLDVKSDVLAGDVLVTNAEGRVQVIFSDDTTISLGGDTRVDVADFVFDAPGEKSSFSARMAQGAARFVTGKVVEQNREGFSVTTPQATVGIRGTTFAVNVSPKGVTSVVGLNVQSAFPISVTNIKTGAVDVIKTSGMAVDASPAGNTSYKAPPGQFSQVGSAVNGKPTTTASSSGSDGNSGSGSATAVAPAVSAAAASSGATATNTVATAPALSDAASVATVAMANTTTSLYNSEPAAARELANSAGKKPEDIGNIGNGSNPGVVVPPDHGGATALYRGNLYKSYTPSAGNIVGEFSFKASLNAGSGNITAANMALSTGGAWADGVVASQNGAAAISGGAFNVNMKVDAVGNTSGALNVGDRGYLQGSFSGTDVSGNWDIRIHGDTQPIYGGGPMHFDGNKQ